MNKLFLLTNAALLAVCGTAFAQAPDLMEKETLPTALLSEARTFTGAEADVMKVTDTQPVTNGAYTLEVVANVTSGNGLEIVSSDKMLKGFHALVGTTQFSVNDENVASIGTGNDATYRFAVDGDKVHIYRNGLYLVSKDKVESALPGFTPSDGAAAEGFDPIPADAALNDNGVSAQAAGWNVCIVKDGTVSALEWSTNGNSRYTDNNLNACTKNGEAFTGRYFFVRWDFDGTNLSDYYVLPVTLKANTLYKFTGDALFWDNFKDYGRFSTKILQFGISADKNVDNNIAYCQIDCNSVARDFNTGTFTFLTGDATQYYLTVCGARAMFGIGNMSIVETTTEPGFAFGKGEGEGEMTLKSVTLDLTGAFAPVATAANRDKITYSESASFTSLTNIDGTLTAGDLHLTGDEPLVNSTIDLQGGWLFLDRIKPSRVLKEYGDLITVDGEKIWKIQENASGEDNEGEGEDEDASEAVQANLVPAEGTLVQADNVRIAIWANGAIVIPHGQDLYSKALTVYDQPNCQGNSKSFEIETYHNDLGEWDNKIKSFRLERGFACCLANNAKGTGHNRFFIADEEDLVFNTMPEGFVIGDQSFVSFIRVFKWQNPGKKAFCGGDAWMLDQLNVASQYYWGGATNNFDVEGVPQHHHDGWLSFESINGWTGITHMLMQNEPDNTGDAKEHPKSPGDVVLEWPRTFESGLRIGSPAPTSVGNWNPTFFNAIDSLNYRCDLAVAHIYQYINADTWKSRIDQLSNIGKGRPCWITEYNNGANWTSESWPTQSGPQMDAEFNKVLDANGQEITVSRPHSPENSALQTAWVTQMLPALDNMDKLERHFWYDWVQDARALMLSSKLTPAGKVFAEYHSQPGYKKSAEYVHNWKLAPPFPQAGPNEDYTAPAVHFYDHNGETAKGYQVQIKTSKAVNAKWQDLPMVYQGVDYQAGETVYVSAPMSAIVKFRVKAIGLDDKESIWSREVTFYQDTEAPKAPKNLTLALASEDGTGGVVCKWEHNDPENKPAGYVIERSVAGGDYVEVGRTTGLTFVDETPVWGQKNTYRVAAWTTADEPTYSRTKSIDVPRPAGVTEVSGDLALSVTVDSGVIVINAGGEYTVAIYGIDGRLVRTVGIHAGATRVEGLAKGIYIVAGTKVIL